MSVSLSTTSRFVACPDSVSCELSGEMVILSMATGQYFALNLVGAHVWRWLQEPCTAESLCERLSEQYEVAGDECAESVSELLAKLVEYKLCEESVL